MIQQSPEIQRAIFQSEMDNVTRDLMTLSSMGIAISRAMLKGLEIRKNNLQVAAQRYSLCHRNQEGHRH